MHIELNRSPPKFLDDNKLKNIPSSFTEYIKPKNIYHKNTYSGKGSRSRPSTSSSGYKNYMKNVSYHNTQSINDNNNLLKFQTTKCKQGYSLNDQINQLGLNTSQKQSL